jgi:hypothetical protein
MIMANWQGQIVDMKGAFLHGEFKDGEVIYIKIPHGFEKFCPDDVVIKLKKSISGLKQAMMAFWRQLLLCMKSMDGAKHCRSLPLPQVGGERIGPNSVVD